MACGRDRGLVCRQRGRGRWGIGGKTSLSRVDVCSFYYFYIRFGIMKIEVTFDRNAKQFFKEECVKRLKRFVGDMKRQTNFQGQVETVVEKENE